MAKLLICFIFLQFSLINAYVSWNFQGGQRWCRSDGDCQNKFLKCMWKGQWNPPEAMGKAGQWGQCRIPWDFGTECNTNHDCVRGSTCDAIFCHGPSTRGPDPVLRKGLKKYCHCTTPPSMMVRNGGNVDDLIIVSDPTKPANPMGKRRRRSLERRQEELLSMIQS